MMRYKLIWILSPENNMKSSSWTFLTTTSLDQKNPSPATPKQMKKRASRNKPIKVRYISNPMRVKTCASKFRELVQELTGQDAVDLELEPEFSPSAVSDHSPSPPPPETFAPHIPHQEPFDDLVAGYYEPLDGEEMFLSQMSRVIIIMDVSHDHKRRPEKTPKQMKKTASSNKPIKVRYISNTMRVKTCASNFPLLRAVSDDSSSRPPPENLAPRDLHQEPFDDRVTGYYEPLDGEEMFMSGGFSGYFSNEFYNVNVNGFGKIYLCEILGVFKGFEYISIQLSNAIM
ncbi:LOW QUALITY PROTEIN: hypothetical protein HID58_060844, partial [Brassica napus]